MAVDTRDKRFSLMNWDGGFAQVLANPTGTIGVFPRSVLLDLYAGISILVATSTAVITLAGLQTLAQGISDEVGDSAVVLDKLQVDAQAFLPETSNGVITLQDLIVAAAGEELITSNAGLTLDTIVVVASGELAAIVFVPPSAPGDVLTEHVLWVDFDDTRWGTFNKLDSAEFENRAFRFQAKLTSENPSTNIAVTRVDVNAEDI